MRTSRSLQRESFAIDIFDSTDKFTNYKSVHLLMDAFSHAMRLSICMAHHNEAIRKNAPCLPACGAVCGLFGRGGVPVRKARCFGRCPDFELVTEDGSCGCCRLRNQCRKKAGVKFALPAAKHHPATRVGGFYAGVTLSTRGLHRESQSQ